jgi:hypothetical protein
MSYSVLNTRAGRIELLVASTQGQALRAYASVRAREINATLTDKQVNTLRTERAEDGAYELRRDGMPLYRFCCIATYFVPSPRQDVDRDGRQSDWQSGKFHN